MNKFFILFFLINLWILTREDAEVSCQFGQTCVLNCSFMTGRDPVIHWSQETPRRKEVHSYYENQDHLENQDQSFKGRTSLFRDQISRGNASLQLNGVMVQDEGSYGCYTSSYNEIAAGETFINMTVYAPVQKINMRQTENLIICSSDGIYPEPHLSWSTSPPSSRTFQNQTTVQKTEELLYHINSSLTLSDREDELEYICTISTPSDQRRASWRRRYDSHVIAWIVIPLVVIAAVIGLVVILVVSLVVWRRRRAWRGQKPSHTKPDLNRNSEETSSGENSETSTITIYGAIWNHVDHEEQQAVTTL
ncbi:hypothetical protein OJAV_G00201360 [Oryzias javanicus]|uniref:Ig-like domain-containing protein n=1 Tax=Oryzias javanicus TaxID=123683 RepID=A0A437C8M9_ORYJA|nr:hypothetical protein OJAV_G00201360 [Oryzias javanicus]